MTELRVVALLLALVAAHSAQAIKLLILSDKDQPEALAKLTGAFAQAQTATGETFTEESIVVGYLTTAKMSLRKQCTQSLNSWTGRMTRPSTTTPATS